LWTKRSLWICWCLAPLCLIIKEGVRVDMARLSIRKVTWYAIIGLLVAVALLPILKAAAPEYFPSVSSISGFRDLDCVGMTCGEGQFCQHNKCQNVATRYAEAVPEGDE
jgi:hypothetical protein